MSQQDLSRYFFEELDKINQHKSTKISQEAICYISNLLLNGTKRDFIFNNNQKKYLVDLYQKSIESNSKRERFQNYKHLGDYSLFISGFFTESIDQVVGINYYIQMGSQAYEQASICLHKDPYQELSGRYSDCVTLMNELSLQRISTSRDVLRLYEAWTSTKNEYTKKKLLKIGVLTEAISE